MKYRSQFTWSLLLLLGLVFEPQLVQAQDPTPDPRFGVVQTYDDFDAAKDSGTGFTRIKLYWDVIQPNGPDEWLPSNVPDPLIETDLEAGREVVALIVHTPTWARDLKHPGNDPDNPQLKDVPDMVEWDRFVRRLVEQYEGRIQHWIIWNEPDVWDPNHPGSTWNGDEADYFRLLKTAYLTIKDVDPTMKVYVAGFTYWWDEEYEREQYLSRLLKIIEQDANAAKNDFYFDGITYHLYYKPQQLYDIISEGRATLDSYNLTDKSIWLNETNAPPSSDLPEMPHREPRFKATLEEQSAFIIQAHAVAFAAGAERVQIYKLYNSSEHPEDVQPFGLLRGDKSRRPAFKAYQVVTTYLAGFERVKLYEQGEVKVVVFERGDETITVLWNMAPTPRYISLNAIANQALVVDETGQTKDIRPELGAYSFAVPPARCSSGDCFIGGSPQIIIEQGSPYQRQPAAVQPTPTPTPTPKPTVNDILLVSPRRKFVFQGLNIAALIILAIIVWRLWIWIGKNQ